MSSLFKSSAPPTPTPVVMPSAPSPVPTMPDIASPTAREAARNEVAASMSGQAGTNLTGKKRRGGAADTVLGSGSDSYGGVKLGGA